MNGIRVTLTHLKTLHMCWYSFNVARKCHQNIPFLEFHERITGQTISKDSLIKLKKKHPHIDTLSYERLEYTLQILSKFGITAIEACKDPHVFSMNPITLDNYGEILKECGFIQILPIHIIKYHTFVRSKTIAQLKKQGLISESFCLESNLLDCFKEWTENKKCLDEFPDSKTSILIVRMSVLERYLKWRLNVTPDNFKKYCRNYLPLKHKPMLDIKKSLNIAQNEIKFDNETIRRNGFIISSDPLNTTLIIDNVPTLAGLDIRDAIKLEPAILKTNYNSLITLKNILEDYQISDEMQRKCLRVYCMTPQTVRDRLKELEDIKEFKILSTNPRVLYMVVHHKKMMTRLNKMKETKKKSFCLNKLVASSQVFNHYINSFGDKSCSRDIVTLINYSLKITETSRNDVSPTQPELKKTLYKQLKRHKYWLHTALSVVSDNLHFLQSKFDDRVLFNNCQLLLYPVQEVENYINLFLSMREGNTELKISEDIQLDVNYKVLNYSPLTDDQLLSLVLYEIEKRYYFSGDGIWTRQDGVKMEPQNAYQNNKCS